MLTVALIEAQVGLSTIPTRSIDKLDNKEALLQLAKDLIQDL